MDPIFLVAYLTLSPLIGNLTKPNEIFLNFARSCYILAAKKLSLSCFFFGKRDPTEEVGKIKFLQVPNIDHVRFKTGHKMIHEIGNFYVIIHLCQGEHEPLISRNDDPESEADLEKHWVKVAVPLNFWIRVGFLDKLNFII